MPSTESELKTKTAKCCQCDAEFPADDPCLRPAGKNKICDRCLQANLTQLDLHEVAYDASGA